MNNYKEKYLKYKTKYENLVGGMSPEKELEAVMTAQKYYEMKQSYKKDKQKIESWCYNEGIDLTDYNIKDWFEENFYLSKRNNDITKLYIPKLIEVNQKFQGDEKVYKNLFKYHGQVAQGGFGTIIAYQSVYYNNYISIKIVASKYSRGIGDIKKEIKATNSILGTTCDVLDAVVIDKTDSSFEEFRVSKLRNKKFKDFSNFIYEKIIGNEHDGLTEQEIEQKIKDFNQREERLFKIYNRVDSDVSQNSDFSLTPYEKKLYSEQDINKYVYYGMILMPFTIYSDASKHRERLKDILLSPNILPDYLKLYIELFKKIILQVKCLIEKHNLVYTDLKLLQVLLWKCKDGKLNYILGDLGGLHEFDEVNPVTTYGPGFNILRTVRSQDIVLFQIAAFWHSIFSTVPEEMELEKNLRKKYIKYNEDWNSNKRKGPITKGPSDEFKKNVDDNLAFPSAFIDATDKVSGKLYFDYPEREQHIRLLGGLRTLMQEWLKGDIVSEKKSKPIHTKETLLYEINRILNYYEYIGF